MILVAILTIPSVSQAQRVSISTDPIRWLTLSPNFGVELALTKHISVDLEFSINTLDHIYSDNLSLKHVSVKPEVRYWFLNQQYGHYIGCGVELLSYNVSLNQKHYEGAISALNISYGYAFLINKRWNITPHVGCNIGMNRKIDYSQYVSGSSQTKFGVYPSSVGVSLTYILN